MEEAGLANPSMFEEVAQTGSIQEIKGIPKHLKELFKTALDVKANEHVRMQAVFQKYTDNAVSKTVNLPTDSLWEDVFKIYMLAYELKCKGITVYRYGSHREQVLNLGKPSKKKKSRAVLTHDEDACEICLIQQ
jgi:ribonucleoside-diphosphate reductase alpha chain